MPNNEVTDERLDALAVAGENGAMYLADGDTTEISTDCGLVARELQRLRAVVAMLRKFCADADERDEYGGWKFPWLRCVLAILDDEGDDAPLSPVPAPEDPCP